MFVEKQEEQYWVVYEDIHVATHIRSLAAVRTKHFIYHAIHYNHEIEFIGI